MKATVLLNAAAGTTNSNADAIASALQAAGKDPSRTIVVGIDGESRARELIKQGAFYRGSVDTSPGLTGQMVINAAVKLLASATIPNNIRVPVTKITAETLK